VAQVLRDAGIRFVVTEWGFATFGDATAQGFSTAWADLAQDEILRAAGAEHTRVMVLTIPQHSTIRLTVQRAAKMNPALIVIARAIRMQNIVELQELGVNATVQPEFEGGIESSRLISFLRSNLYEEGGVNLTGHQ
jgi:Trk K+ transport system NAD-binding subunit